MKTSCPFLTYNMPRESAAKGFTINQSIIGSYLENDQMTILAHQERSPSSDERKTINKSIG